MKRLPDNIVPREPGEVSWHSYAVWEVKPSWLLSEGEWQMKAPDGSLCALGRETTTERANHTVVEHADGTITVSPSIVTRTWHGFLIQGEFTP